MARLRKTVVKKKFDTGLPYDLITRAPKSTKSVRPTTRKYPAVMKGQAVHHDRCGGQVMIDAAIHGLTDFGFGFVGRKFQVERTYSSKPIGYKGQCLKCGKAGAFILKRKRGK